MNKPRKTLREYLDQVIPKHYRVDSYSIVETGNNCIMIEIKQKRLEDIVRLSTCYKITNIETGEVRYANNVKTLCELLTTNPSVIAFATRNNYPVNGWTIEKE